MYDLNSRILKLFVVLSAVILTTIIYASLPTAKIRPQKHMHSIGGSPKAHSLLLTGKLNSSSHNPGRYIGKRQLTETRIKPELRAFQAVSVGSDIVEILRRKLNEYQTKSKKRPRKRKKSHKPVTIESTLSARSSLQTSRGTSPFRDHPVLTVKLYESGHLNDGIDKHQICKHWGSYPKLLILITSAESHLMERMAIRQTWMHYGSRRDVGMAFVLGSTTNAKLNEALSKENYLYGDMIRGHSIDSHINLTLKTISLLEWTDTHCPRVKYILKTEDDMFINVPKLLDFIDVHKDNRTIYGRLVEQMTLHDEFLSYAIGGAYLLTGDIVHELYVQSLNTFYMEREEVFITGVVAESLNISRVQADSFRNIRITLFPCSIRNTISIDMIEPQEQYELWRMLLDPNVKCKEVLADAEPGENM
ncbi:beta-1,3-galactosyltransferase 5-like [Drosophila pseudoobscura]|uniref:Hexosyltransferase n=1 Tax=Drosophila pseudoobscura pseudoobscura TaxID=46245 RepID=A0A6I8W042_DROPS|nr:beta-1,3-galactosyltransferase 5 [Drosophila pseudoobscura]